MASYPDEIAEVRESENHSKSAQLRPKPQSTSSPAGFTSPTVLSSILALPIAAGAVAYEEVCLTYLTEHSAASDPELLAALAVPGFVDSPYNTLVMPTGQSSSVQLTRSSHGSIPRATSRSQLANRSRE